MSTPARMYRPVPSTPKRKGETRPLAERRPIYATPDHARLPGIGSYGVTASGALVVAIEDYEVVRDKLYAAYGPVEVIHDDLVYPDWSDEGFCWPQCRGAATVWWACGCPCAGSNHGGVDHLLNYVLEDERLAGEHVRVLPSGVVQTFEVRRRTYTYRHPAVASGGGHLHAV